jgi:YHS domain-containing protein
VVSGTFLIDSESRIKAAAAGITGETSEDPVCGMEVDQSKARAAGLTIVYKGQIHYFCSDECKISFEKAPARYTDRAGSRLQAVGSEWGKAQSAERIGPSVEGRGRREAGSRQLAAGSQKPTSGGQKMEAPHADHMHP